MEIAKYIDHTFLKASGTEKDIKKLIEEAKKYQFRAICIHPCWVKYAKKLLKNTDIRIATVIGFPLGANITQIKVHEASLAVKHGADDIDMVINIGKFKDGKDAYIIEEINKIKQAIGSKILKVIVETALLKQDEIKRVAKLVLQSHADFIKTSTGFSFSGAKLEDVKIFNKILGDKKKIKAAGGVKSVDDLKKMVDAGAEVIGTSSGVALVENQTIKGGY